MRLPSRISALGLQSKTGAMDMNHGNPSSHRHGQGFMEAAGVIYAMQFAPLRLFVFGVILYALCGGH